MLQATQPLYWRSDDRGGESTSCLVDSGAQRVLKSPSPAPQVLLPNVNDRKRCSASVAAPAPSGATDTAGTASVSGTVKRPNGQLYHPRRLSGLPDVTPLPMPGSPP
jgi:hypothetical protein